MITISPIQSRILEALATFKWLTVSQTFLLLQNKNIHTIYNDVKSLRDRGFIDCVVYGGVSRTGTMEKLNFLTPKGAKIVAEDLWHCPLQEIKYIKSTTTLVKNDFQHRINTVSTMISLTMWAASKNYPVVFIDYYFDKIGSQRRKNEEVALHSKTRVEIDQGNSITPNKYVDPDVIFSYAVSGQQKVFVLEVANGRDTDRIIKQIRQNLYASYQGFVGSKYSYESTPRILVAFERHSTLKAVISTAKNDPYIAKFEQVEKFLFFGLISDLILNWNKWRNIGEELADIFS